MITVHQLYKHKKLFFFYTKINDFFVSEHSTMDTLIIYFILSYIIPHDVNFTFILLGITNNFS